MGCVKGCTVGRIDGIELGMDGCDDGTVVGCIEGTIVG